MCWPQALMMIQKSSLRPYEHLLQNMIVKVLQHPCTRLWSVRKLSTCQSVCRELLTILSNRIRAADLHAVRAAAAYVRIKQRQKPAIVTGSTA